MTLSVHPGEGPNSICRKHRVLVDYTRLLDEMAQRRHALIIVNTTAATQKKHLLLSPCARQCVTMSFPPVVVPDCVQVCLFALSRTHAVGESQSQHRKLLNALTVFLPLTVCSCLRPATNGQICMDNYSFLGKSTDLQKMFKVSRFPFKYASLPCCSQFSRKISQEFAIKQGALCKVHS